MKKIFALIAISLFLCACNVPAPIDQKDQNATPQWVSSLIKEAQSQPIGTKPTEIRKCIYQGDTVYHVISPCCDNYNYLYSTDNKTICAPDGGITGKGDGKCPDFSLNNNSCEIIWMASENN